MQVVKEEMYCVKRGRVKDRKDEQAVQMQKTMMRESE